MNPHKRNYMIVPIDGLYFVFTPVPGGFWVEGAGQSVAISGTFDNVQNFIKNLIDLGANNSQASQC